MGVSLLLLISLSGTHWWVLQSVAWSGMIVSYSAKSGLVQGLEETFDGDHPCKMCNAIEQARESESNATDTLAPAQKQVQLLGLPPEAALFIASHDFPKLAASVRQAAQFNSPPPVPPPRSPLA